MVEEKNAGNDKDSLAGLSKGANFKNSKIIYASKGNLLCFPPCRKKLSVFSDFQLNFEGFFFLHFCR